ncbi:MAG: FtsX-like permease family protein [bacterium]|nr:FtsX-like permease family protein [bacterium]
MNRTYKKIPALAGWIIRNILPDNDADYLNGDIEELYNLQYSSRGAIYAGLWLTVEICKSIPNFFKEAFLGRCIMIKNYLKIAVRNIRKYKTYSFINITGLAVGLACCILLVLYIYSELSFDTFHERSERIYRLGFLANVGGNIDHRPRCNAPAALVLKKDYPEVEDAARIGLMQKALVKYDVTSHYEDAVLFADNSVFSVFTFPMTAGDPETALKAPYSVVITKKTAEKYFGDEDPLGKVLLFNDTDNYTVTGVVKDVPDNSHFRFDMLCSMQTLYSKNNDRMEVWVGYFIYYTYLLLGENTDYLAFEERLADVVDQYMGDMLKAYDAEFRYFLQPLTDIHLHSNLAGELSENSDIKYVYIFSSVVVLILLIACINYMNLSTARSVTRAKEIGIRKVVGAEKREIIRQFLSESIIYCFISLIIAFALVKLSIPYFNSIINREINIGFSDIQWLIPLIILATFIIGVFSGSYPAFYLSSFNPGTIIKGGKNLGKNSGSRFRNILVIFQFTTSIALIIGTLIISDQLDFLKTKELGFEKDNILVIPIDRSLSPSINTLREQLGSITGIIGVTASSSIPGERIDVNLLIPEGYTEAQGQFMERINVDAGFLNTMKIELIQGRNFSNESEADVINAVIINESAVKKFNWRNPIDKTFTQVDGSEPKRVIGVVKDFHVQSLYSVIEPLYLCNGPRSFNYLTVKLSSTNIPSVIEKIKDTWSRINQDTPFEHYFLDSSINNKYKNEERLRKVFSSFTLFAIFIACLGLFGFISFAAEQKAKEIGIRKVLGSGITQIIILYCKNISGLIIIGNVFAWFAAYFLSDIWLQNFPYRTGIDWQVFVIAGAITFLIAIITIIYHVLKSAFANPVDSLRCE